MRHQAHAGHLRVYWPALRDATVVLESGVHSTSSLYYIIIDGGCLITTTVHLFVQAGSYKFHNKGRTTDLVHIAGDHQEQQKAEDSSSEHLMELSIVCAMYYLIDRLQ